MEDWKVIRLNELRNRMKMVRDIDSHKTVKAALAEAVAPFVPSVEQIKQHLQCLVKAEYNGLVLEVGLPNINGITVISCGHLYATYHSLARVEELNVGWEESCTMLQQFTANNNAFYYARPAEDFTTYEAMRLTREAGKSIVVLENLS